MPRNPAELAQKLAVELDVRQVDYAIGGAVALGFWGEPRGTLDAERVGEAIRRASAAAVTGASPTKPFAPLICLSLAPR